MLQDDRKRDVSPSTISQSSGLEWDPSADVGTSKLEGAGVGQLQVEDGERRPRFSRSRSYEYPLEELEKEFQNVSQHQASLRELPISSKQFINDWVQTGVTIDDTFKAMVDGFNTRRQIMQTVQGTLERPGSSSTTVSTVLPPPNSNGSNNTESDDNLPEDLQKLDRTKDGNPIDTDFDAVFRRKDVGKNRSYSMVNLGSSESNAPLTRGSDASKMLVSNLSASAEAFGENGNRRELSGRSEISDWLEIGMTKSEKEFKRYKEGKSGSGKSSSIMYVEVQTSFNTKKPHEVEVADTPFRNVGVQTSTSVRGKDASDWSTSYSSVYHSTPADNLPRLPLNHKSDTVDIPEAGGSRQYRRRERSPPQPFAVASRKSSHRHHHANHSKNNDGHLHAKHQRSHREASTSSDMSPPCFFIDKYIKTNESSKKKDDVLNAIEIHRDYHVKKVRHEIRQLEKLNHLLSEHLVRKRSQHQHGSHSSDSSHKMAVFTTSSSANDERAKHSTKQGNNRTKVDDFIAKQRTSPVKLVDAYQDPTAFSSKQRPEYHPLVKQRVNLNRRRDTSSTCPNSQVLSLSKSESLLKARKGKDSKSENQDPVDKKLDELMRAFSTIADLLQEKNKATGKDSRSAKKLAKRNILTNFKPKKPVQNQPIRPPVSYFIPFTNRHEKYLFTQEEIHSSFGQGKINKSLIDTDTRPTSRQETLEEENKNKNNDDSWDDVDENNENIDPNSVRISTKPSIQKYTLQDAFQRSCPNFLNRLKKRQNILSKIKSEREMRAETKREWIRLYGKDSRGLKDLNSILPPKGPRLMSTKEMHELTKRHYKNLPEVQEKKLQRKVEEEKKINRIMSQVFAQQLRKEVLRGEINFVHSRSLVRRQ